MTPVVLPQRMLRHASYALLLTSAAGCVSYNERTEAALGDFERGRFQAAEVGFVESLEDEGDFLSGAERGMVALTAGDWSGAVSRFTDAAEAVRDAEREALVSPESAGELLTRWVINDTFTAYAGEGYERVMLHACLGMAYLALGELQDTLVEVRLANRLLESEEELFETEYRAGGLGHFLSAIAYELRGDLSDAYIDYARMAEKDLAPEVVGPALVRLARALGRTEAVEEWEGRYGEATPIHDGAANIVVLAGVGMGPFKQEARLTVPTESGLLSWTVPDFVTRPQPVSRLELSDSVHDASVSTVVIEDVSAVAEKNLSDRLAWLATRSTVRTFLKRELRRELSDQHGELGALVGDLFTLFSEQADLRAWSTLPDSWQVARMYVPTGPVDLTLSAPSGKIVPLGAYHLDPGETLFVIARSLGTSVHAHAIGGQPLEVVPDLPEEPSGS